ncbi:MAG TPA: RHS repeat-associated core domain-containing protein, partial [Candidatus Angelobacter sp.]
GSPPEDLGQDDSSANATSRFQGLPPLQAAPGQTALAGQVLKLNGWPLEHVTLEIDGEKTRTDSTGRFLLTNLAPGHHVLWIDGATANHERVQYGVYEVGVTILAGKTNVLNYTIWMTRLDTDHTVTIPSPTTREMVITNPGLPGLELHLPAGTVITDRYGKVVHQVGITAIPVDKPPFPLPGGVQVPIYFTIQPGGAYLSGPGARLIYPNASNLKPGTPFDFWNYDADVKGWFIYGSGHVSPDARSVIPDPGVVIYEFTGAMVGSKITKPGVGAPVNDKAKDGDPVDLSTGQFTYSKTDLAVADVIPLTFSRTYIANDSLSRSFGIGATNSYAIFMVGDTSPYTYQELILPDGGSVRFDRISSGTSYGDAVYVHASAHDAFYGARLQWSGGNPALPGSWQLTLTDGTMYFFPEAPGSTNPNCEGVVGIRDRYGNQVRLDRSSPNANCNLNKITSPNGRYIALTYDAQNRISQAQDNLGRTVNYTYDGAGRLSTVTDVGGGVSTYTYDDQNRLLTIKDPRGIVYLTNQYDSSGRVTQQTNADGGAYLFNWTASGNTSQARVMAGAVVNDGSEFVSSGCWLTSGVDSFNRYSSSCGEGYLPLVTQVDVTDPRGYVRRVHFGPTGYPTSDTHALGQPEQQTTTYSYYSDNLLQSVTDALGRTTSFDYDVVGNTTRVTSLDGTPNAVTSTMAYNAPFYKLSSVTDPLGHTSTFSYDSSGNLIQTTDPLNHLTTTTYNPNGQIASVSDALNNTVQFGYFQNDPVSVTDPVGNTSTSFHDAVGRLISAVDPQGNTSSYQYSNLNLLTQVTDVKGNNTSFSYDGNGNLLSLTDALNHTTTYTYDNMDQVHTRTDPLLRQESYSYDLNGNVVSATDRKGQVTTFSYDALNRLKFVGFKTVVNGGNTTYESTISFTYDAGNRMTQAVDSAGGTIARSYDNLDRLTSETTAQGSISYGYDTAGRQTSMQVTGQPQVSYTYDNADRLTQITQSSSNTSFGYDIADRRTSLTLPNGVAVSYTYDNSSRLTGITYQFGTNTLGNLTYSYDQLGRRTLVGGSFARTGLPGAITSATYDAANQLTNWNGTALSYDQNGNMLGDGANAFAWNARDQVATLNGVGLQYDAFGRRIKNRAGTSFLYDGANAAQELSGSTVTANLLSGGIDEVFIRTDTSGAFTPLKDALGSTIALVDSSGSLQTSYTYDPFGNTSVTGTSNANEFQYTGRENEGNGLYFYRARYYSPLLGRFINEDPLGFAGSGPNLYAYVLDSPTNLSDAFGLQGGGTGVAEPPVDKVAQVIQKVATAAGVGTTAATTSTVAVSTSEGTGEIVTLIAGGSGEGSVAGPAGVLVGIGAAAVGGIIYEWRERNHALDALDRANAELRRVQQLEHQAELNLLNQPKPLPGRESKKSPDECRKQLQECIEQCTDELRKGEWPFRRCVAKCMDDAGCDYTIPRPFYNPPPR